MPSTVRNERSLLARSDCERDPNGFAEEHAPPSGLSGLLALVRLDLAVADVDRAVRVVGDVALVGDQDDGVALLVQPLEEAHDLVAGRGVEVAGRLVGQQDRGVHHQRARDRHALALAAGELVRLVGHAVGEVDHLEGVLRLLEPLLLAGCRRRRAAARRCGARSRAAAG